MKDKLLKIRDLIAEWTAQGGADTLERDLALELLREVYAEIKFGQSASVQPQQEPVTKETEPTLDAAEVENETCEFVATETEAEAEPIQEPEITQEQVIMPKPVAPEIIKSLYGEGYSGTLGESLGAGRKTLADMLEKKDI